MSVHSRPKEEPLSVEALRVLLIEPDRDYAGKVVTLLAKEQPRFQVDWIDNTDGAVDILSSRAHAVHALLIDLAVCETQNPEALARIREQARDIPLLMLTDDIGGSGFVRAIETDPESYFDKRSLDGFLLARTLLERAERKQQCDELLQFEKRMELYVHRSPLAAIEWDAGLSIISWNPAAEKVFGYSREEAMGKSVSSLFPENIRNGTRQLLLNEFDDMRGQGLGIDNVRKDGQAIRCEWHNTPLKTTEGRLVAVASMVKDVSERQAVFDELQLDEARLESLLRISQYEAEDTQRFFDYALEEAVLLTKSKLGYIYFYNDKTEEFTLNTWSQCATGKPAIADPQRTYGLDENTLWGDAVRQRKAIIHNDSVPLDPREKAYPSGSAELYRFLTAPVFVKDRIVAVVGVANKNDPYDQADIRQLTLLVDTAWKVAENRRIEQRIRNAAREWRTTFDSIGDPITIVDRDFEIVRLNMAAARFLGMSISTAIGTNWRDVIPDAKDLAELCPLQKMIESGKHEETETFLKKRGQWVWASVDPVFDTDGELFRAVHIVKDITERKKGEDAVKKSEQRYRSIFENASEGIFQATSDCVFSNVNPSLANMCGFSSPPEMITALKEGFRFFARSDDEAKYLRSLGDFGLLDKFEVEARKQDGTSLWVTINGHTSKDLSGSTGYEGTVGDITERKRTETALRESEMRYKGLFEHADEAIFLINGSRLIDCNPKTLVMFGYSREEILNISPGAISPISQPDGSDSKHLIARKMHAAVLGVPQSFEWRFQRKDGTGFDGEVSLNSITLRGEILLLSMVRDISRRKAAEETSKRVLTELEAKNHELESIYEALKISQRQVIQQEKMASIGQLAAGVAHEINNPVGFIMSNLNSMSKYVARLVQFLTAQSEALSRVVETAPAARQVLAKIEEKRQSLKVDYIIADIDNLIRESLEGTERAKRIVQDLKSFSRIDESEQKASDINQGLESTINVVWNELKYRAEVKKDYGDIPLTRCNLGQLNQVFMNLLVNAAQAITTRGVITVKTVEADGDIVVTITDNGCGIPPEKLNRIFEPFFTTKEVGKGTGLGLSIAYDIVKKHNGRMEVNSEAGEGTVFSVFIPVVEV